VRTLGRADAVAQLRARATASPAETSLQLLQPGNRNSCCLRLSSLATISSLADGLTARRYAWGGSPPLGLRIKFQTACQESSGSKPPLNYPKHKSKRQNCVPTSTLHSKRTFVKLQCVPSRCRGFRNNNLKHRGGQRTHERLAV